MLVLLCLSVQLTVISLIVFICTELINDDDDDEADIKCSRNDDHLWSLDPYDRHSRQ